ncbi:MAG TPA: hypothetical protein VNH83_12675 [Bryobacteraceae bacterium]|nr:hypothetical protein [Bryobacteraceae bacterium]
MPLNTSISTGSPICYGPRNSLCDGFQFQAGPTNSDEAQYPTVFTGPIVAPQLSDAVALPTHHGRPGTFIACQLTMVGVTAFDGDLLGSIDGVTYAVILQQFNTPVSQAKVGIDAQGCKFLKFRVNSMDAGTCTPLISE